MKSRRQKKAAETAARRENVRRVLAADAARYPAPPPVFVDERVITFIEGESRRHRERRLRRAGFEP